MGNSLTILTPEKTRVVQEPIVLRDAAPLLVASDSSSSNSSTIDGFNSNTSGSGSGLFHWFGNIPRRYVMIVMCFIAVAINYSDRTNIRYNKNYSVHFYMGLLRISDI